ncbi:MAG: LLM class F420-dependent oxidoreductase [Candidatus Binatia bacterium]|nr:LLM class F420-dependent oxidoreductase [Candidatus Binatia bacterium]
MKFGLMFANVGPFGQPEMLTSFSQAAEAAGIESLWTVEHVAVPVGYESTYPYSPDGKMPGPENSPIPDPMLPLAFAAAVTKKIKFGTGILILPQRHPIYVAKEAATLDQLSSGRFMLGIGIGWLAEEFAALGVPFEDRASRTRECVDAIRTLWKDGAHAYDGKFFRWPAIESNPKPVQAGGVPIVVGGHTDISAKRAARYGDGFFPAMQDLAQVEHLKGVITAECTRLGRDPAEVELSVGAGFADLDYVKRCQDLGVARIGIAPMGFDMDSLSKGLDDLNDRILSKI